MKFRLYLIVWCIGLLSCSENTRKYESVTFGQLDATIQDTLIKLSNRLQVLWQNGEDSLLSQNDPEMVDFTGKYKMIKKEFGPWILMRVLVDTVNNRSYRFTYNPPTPIVITEQYIIIPQKYNMLTSGFEKNTLFQRKMLND